MLVRIALLLMGCLAGVGCSSFNQQWNALAEPAPTAKLGDRWEGLWRSDVSGHEGKLRCIVVPQEAEGSLFRFSATWGPGIVSDYDIQMQTTPRSEGGQAFEGEMDLGWLMGTYRSKGTIIGDTFRATYQSKQDHGVFEMSRVK